MVKPNPNPKLTYIALKRRKHQWNKYSSSDTIKVLASSKLYSVRKQQKNKYYSRNYNKHVKKYFRKRKEMNKKGDKMGLLNKL